VGVEIALNNINMLIASFILFIIISVDYKFLSFIFCWVKAFLFINALDFVYFYLLKFFSTNEFLHCHVHLTLTCANIYVPAEQPASRLLAAS